MQFRQKKWMNRRAFDFHEERFTYLCEDESGSTKRDFGYLELPSKTEIFESTEKNLLFLVGVISFFIVGMLQYMIFLVWKDEVRLTMVTLAGVAFVIYRTTRTKFLEIPAAKGTISVIRNSDAEAILQELYGGRARLLRARYLELVADPEVDLDRRDLEWLVEEGVISAEELASHRPEHMSDPDENDGTVH